MSFKQIAKAWEIGACNGKTVKQDVKQLNLVNEHYFFDNSKI